MIGTSDNVRLSISTELFEFISEKDVLIDELVVVYCLENNKKSLLNIYLNKRNNDQRKALFQRLERKMLIRKLTEDLEDFDLDNYDLEEKSKQLLEECNNYFEDFTIVIKEFKEDKNKFQEFVDEYRGLWPSGKKNLYGNYLKGNKIDIEKRLKIFLNRYNYDFDTILKVTEHYIRKQSETNYQYCSPAHYYILKDGVSKLATDCENYNDSENSNDYDSFVNQIM